MTRKDIDLLLGVELEVPFKPEGHPKGVAKGEPSEIESLEDNELHAPQEGGEITHELICTNYSFQSGGASCSEYGLEARTPDGGIHYRAIGDWYEATYREIEERFGREIEPTGFYGNGTAGLHTHLSPITEEKADDLFEASKEPFMQVFCSASVAAFTSDGNPDADIPVTRPAHCQLPEKRKDNHDCCVNKHRSGGDGHYEWRLPEPMYPDHFRLLVEFIARFVRDTDDGLSFARRLVTEGDERLTAIRRFKKIEPELPDTFQARSETAELLRTVSQ